MKKRMYKDCEICHKRYQCNMHNQKYCQPCKEIYNSPVRKKRLFGDSISTSTTGAIGEYIVVADLLKKGYEVFKAASPTCSCDLIILKDGIIKRIEVRTAYILVNGKDYHIDTHGFRADILAGVCHENNKIIYMPEL